MGSRRVDPADAGTAAPAARDPFKIVRFSTDDFPQHKRIEAYRDIFGRTIVKHDIEPIGGEPFRFEASVCSLPGVGLASSVFSPCRRWHGPQHTNGDDLVLGIGLSGGCVVRQHGREAVIAKGEAVLTSTADPADVLIATTSQAISLRVPNILVRSGTADLDACLARRIPGDSEGLRLLTDYIGVISDAEALKTPALRETVATHIHDLILLILGARRDARALAEQRGVRAARRAAILQIIASRSNDPSLSAIAVAAALGVTPRYVHLLLEETGRSFTHHVLQLRLEKAAALLRDPNWHRRTIAEIALEAGFTDLSRFSRAFRGRFGMSPTDMRMAARHA